ncbi:Asp-tRNA(Asn)/Glu-tRNA(Gln) amidotransferase subunit GatA [candidate division WOR-3 bacterium]|nr:Asp-tRNA(Asn)/Glu-tRNA(Gln) amidotransferase subunit GatA [candidate division WOR-3 bacterium]
MKTIPEYQELFKKGEITPTGLLTNCLKKINPSLNAYITVTEELARKGLKKDSKGKLRGIPIAVKDNINIKGVPTTCASNVLKGFIPPFSATVIERIEKNGGIFIGKTNLDEFGMGSSTERSYYGPTKNPFDETKVPGGSSGGSAAAVSSGSAVISLGSDTGGSVRQPASYCGLVGLKPTYGRVSRYGLVAFGSSLDQIGIIGRNSVDVGIMLEVIAGYDPKDSTSSKKEIDDYSDLNEVSKNIKIGIPEEYFKHIDPGVHSSVMEIKRRIEKEGISFKSVSLPTTGYIIPTYQVISYAEASSNLARYDGVRYGLRKNGESFHDTIRKSRDAGFLPEVKRRILVGTFVLSSEAIAEYYERADLIRRLITQEFNEVFREVDYLLTPATPTPAFPIGERTDDPIRMHVPDRMTAGANLAGLPAVVAPAGMIGNLPIGYQIIGKPFDEKGILSIVRLVEKMAPFEGFLKEVRDE